MFEFNFQQLLRSNIRSLVPYSSARAEFKGLASVWLDANENAWGSPTTTAYNRYPDPMQMKLKQKLSSIKGLLPDCMFIGNGSDEAIDLLFRACCNPGKDNVVVCPPTYGMYEVSANINDVEVRRVPLLPDFQLDLERISEAVDECTKIIFLCSPNNPTGNCLHREDIEIVLHNFNGLVVIDEAYINYARHRSFIPDLTEYPNLVVLQTLSKAWGLAGLRIGMAFASPEIIEVLNRIKPPYNVSEATQQLALDALEHTTQVNTQIRKTVEERDMLIPRIANLGFVQKVYPSEANFLLVKMDDPKRVYTGLTEKGIVVRDRSSQPGCEGCLRITIGTPEENMKLIDTLKNLVQ
ncbi:MAG: histidinol-phosphate transaminase [Bacteroidia bacterium]|jgi:histidinol-phosphate aminotransferase|nr:histidinol-phosphate transaminase [Bacteroidia bacterium]